MGTPQINLDLGILLLSANTEQSQRVNSTADYADIDYWAETEAFNSPVGGISESRSSIVEALSESRLFK